MTERKPVAEAEFGSIMGEIGTYENFGNKTGGGEGVDRLREHCIYIFIAYVFSNIYKKNIKNF